ncbi:MAG: flavodoxin family protein [Desulfobacterales bacterium]|nr:flavodoxin family protein [Desulfobacterales bacterium]
MKENKVKILGINGSPRREGNTSTMVKYCLEWAETAGFVETEYLALADYELKHCTGCMKCFGFMAPADDEYQCYDTNDDIRLLAPKVAECDGLLIGFPVYSGGLPGIMRIFIEKMHHFGPMSFTRHAGALKYKALGIISQGGQLYGGQENTFKDMSFWGSIKGMHLANAWPTVDAPMPSSSFFGGILTTVDGSAIYGKHSWKKEATRTIPPASGSRNERSLKNLGRHLATDAMVMKLGREAFAAAGFTQPETIPFTNYSVKPKKGSYVDRLIKEGKVTYVSQKELEERAARKK